MTKTHNEITEHLFRFTEPSKLYIRVLLTELCNSKCVFCFKECSKGNDDKLFGMEFFRELVRVAEKHAIPKIHFTGGEPLLINEVADYIGQVTKRSTVDVGLTTNGTLLHNHAGRLYAAGLRRINVSLPSLRSARYQAICGQDMLKTVLLNIDIAIDTGFWPVKINIPVYGENADEMLEFMEYFLPKDGVILRFFSILPNDGIPARSCLTFEETTTYLDEAIDQIEGNVREEATKRVYYRPPFLSCSSICATCTKRNYCQDQAKAIRISRDGNVRLCLANPAYATQVERLRDIDRVVSNLLDLYYS